MAKSMMHLACLPSCVPAGIFPEIVVSRKGAYSCPVASGIIFAVNADVPGDAGAPLDAYCQGLLASMQARQPCWSGKNQGAYAAIGSM